MYVRCTSSVYILLSFYVLFYLFLLNALFPPLKLIYVIGILVLHDENYFFTNLWINPYINNILHFSSVYIHIEFVRACAQTKINFLHIDSPFFKKLSPLEHTYLCKCVIDMYILKVTTFESFFIRYVHSDWTKLEMFFFKGV